MYKHTFRPSINGIRGIAILMVVFYHWSHLRGGFTGVDVFFVISGYLISANIIRDLNEGQFSFATFFAKRTRRIFPSLAVVLLFSLGLGWFKFFSDQLLLLGKHIQAGSFFLSNFRLYGEAGYFDSAAETKPLLHLWSLAVEEQFYLFWPVLLWAAFKVFRSVKGLVVSAIILSFATNIYFSTHDTAMNFYMLPSRLWELAFGCFVFMSRSRFHAFYNSKVTQLGGLFLIVWGAFTIRGQQGFPGFAALIPVLGAGFLLGASEDSLVNRKILSSRLLGFFGTISFTLYLWHWPLYSFMKSIMIRNSQVGLVVGTLVLSYLTHRLIEKPLMRFPITNNSRFKVILTGVAVLSAIGILGTLIGNGSIKGRVKIPPLLGIINSEKPPGMGCSVNADYGNTFSPDSIDILKSCAGNNYPGAPRILLLGDSHASVLTGGMKAFADQAGANVAAVGTISCTPLSIHDRRPACRDFNRFIEQWISKWKPDVVILFAYHLYLNNNENFGESVSYPKFIVSKLKEIKKLTGKEVLLIGQIPTWQVSLPRVVNIAFHSKGIPVPERTYEGVSMDSVEFDQVLKDEAASQQVPYFSLKDELCNREGCLLRVGERLETDLIVLDYGHLSWEGSKYVLSHGLGEKISDLLPKSAK